MAAESELPVRPGLARPEGVDEKEKPSQALTSKTTRPPLEPYQLPHRHDPTQF